MCIHKNIFLVDDDKDDQLFFVDAIMEINNKIKYTIANDGREALDTLINSEILPDLIFMDINMPVMNGIECLGHLKNGGRFHDIPVIVLSTASHEEANAYQSGASVFITKPANEHLLKAKLEQILNSQFSDPVKIVR